MRAAVETWIRDTYRRPDGHLEGLNALLLDSLQMRLLPLSVVNRHLGRRWADAVVPPWLPFESSQEWSRPPDPVEWAREIKDAKKEKRAAPTRLTSLTPFGAQAFPWLLEFCERPA